MFKKWARRIGIVIGGLIATWCVTGLVLALLPAPRFETPQPDVAALVAPPLGDTIPQLAFETQDGITLRARRYPGDAGTTVVLLHGVLADARLYEVLAERVRERSGAEVLALDLRGHGLSEGTRGDVAYIGQYGDDVGAVIDQLRRRRPTTRIILAGHSMGGGIALRYAERRTAPAPDGYLLFAPLLGPDSPTFRDESPDAPEGAEVESPMRVHVPRLIGLLMLNTVGIRALNGMTTLLFNMPAEAPIRSYSYRAMVSMTPASHVAALGADSLPLLAIVGSADEAFHVDRFPEVIGRHANGEIEIIDGSDHTGLLFSEEAAATAARWLGAFDR